MDNKEYYLGLDIGTNSVGWAVTDTNYNILKLKGKSAWGVRLFDEANSAADRRTSRQNRRRWNRKKWRLELIRQLFEKEINKVDDSFYMRMKDSPLFLEDKNVKMKYVLFNDNDKKFTDKEYFFKYPTIYHLRKELMDSEEPHDVRLVFLAVYHIVKNRGHFLWSNISDIDKNADIKSCLITLFESMSDIFLDKESTEVIESVGDEFRNSQNGEEKQSIEDSAFVGAKLCEPFSDLKLKIDDIETILISDKTKNDKKRQ